MPFYLENVLGYSTREVGVIFAAVPIAMGIVAPIAGSLSDRLGTRPITVIGLGILLIGYYAMSKLTANTSTVGFLLLFLPIGIGMGVFQSPNNSAIMGTAPPTRLGIVSGMLAVNRTLGQTTGIAMLGAIWVSRTLMYSEPLKIENATEASTFAQVSALQDTFLVITIIILLAFTLGVWALLRERRSNVATDIKPKPVGQ